LRTSLAGAPSDLFDHPHFLDTVQVVWARANEPLLWVATASLNSTDGNQLKLSEALAYRRVSDSFERVYEKVVGHNNNEEVRFVTSGPLKGDIISVEPTSNAPFGFWVTLNAQSAGQAYRQVLRYRSATRYGDGNPLAVIDSEMPNIESRLGAWKTGQRLPLPASGCAKPHLVKTELWCS